MKIAICLSGQTTDYNSENMMHMFSNIFPSYEIDFYGHTWSDQHPPTNITDFYKFEQTDQSEIFENLKEDIWDMAPYQTWWNKHPDYLENPIDFVKQRIDITFGQFVGHYSCIKLITNPMQYDAIFRWRWDAIHTKDDQIHYASTYNNLIKDWIASQNNFSVNTEEKDNKIIKPILAETPMSVQINGKVFLRDNTFMFDADAVVGMQEINIYEALKKAYQIQRPPREHSHLLWPLYFQSIGKFGIRSELPRTVVSKYMNINTGT
jgi:hypothetical protein